MDNLRCFVIKYKFIVYNMAGRGHGRGGIHASIEQLSYFTENPIRINFGHLTPNGTPHLAAEGVNDISWPLNCQKIKEYRFWMHQPKNKNNQTSARRIRS